MYQRAWTNHRKHHTCCVPEGSRHSVYMASFTVHKSLQRRCSCPTLLAWRPAQKSSGLVVQDDRTRWSWHSTSDLAAPEHRCSLSPRTACPAAFVEITRTSSISVAKCPQGQPSQAHHSALPSFRSLSSTWHPHPIGRQPKNRGGGMSVVLGGPEDSLCLQPLP